MASVDPKMAGGEDAPTGPQFPALVGSETNAHVPDPAAVFKRPTKSTMADVAPVRRAKLMGNPWLIHVIVIGSGLLIHGGSADGAMAAIVSGLMSALYVRYQQRFFGHIRANQWHPGVFRVVDPRVGAQP